MASFVSSNSGLASRFPNVFNFADYTHEEMAGILKSVAIEKGFTLADDLAHDQLVQLVKRSVKAGEASKGKHAVGLSRLQNWAEEELVEGEEAEQQ